MVGTGMSDVLDYLINMLIECYVLWIVLGGRDVVVIPSILSILFLLVTTGLTDPIFMLVI